MTEIKKLKFKALSDGMLKTAALPLESEINTLELICNYLAGEVLNVNFWRDFFIAVALEKDSPNYLPIVLERNLEMIRDEYEYIFPDNYSSDEENGFVKRIDILIESNFVIPK